LGARAAVATACALLAACLAGTVLYVSSSASEAAQIQLDQTCGADAGLSLPVYGDDSIRFLTDLAAHIPHTATPIVTMSVPVVFRIPGDESVSRRMVLVHRDGQSAAVTPALRDDGDGLAFPAAGLHIFGLAVGDHVLVDPPRQFTLDSSGQVVPDTSGATDPIDFAIDQRFDDIAVQPEPSFWCGLRGLLRPKASGDPRPPVVLVSASTMALVRNAGNASIEIRVADDRLTHAETADVAAAFEAAIDRYASFLHVSRGDLIQQGAADGVPTIRGRASSLAQTVAKTVAPVRLAGVLASMLVLVAASVMVARERRRELRLLALRGVTPMENVRRLLRLAAGPTSVGAGVGLALALVAVRTLGPTPELEPGALVRAVVTVAIAVVVATLLVALVVAFVGDRFVDGRSRRRRWRWVPVELPLVGLALVSYHRLDDLGGVRTIGVESRGGDLLAQAFPLLGVIAALAILARPLRWLVHRSRLAGARLPRAIRLGLRRVVAEPAATTGMVLAVALAAACFTLAGVLSASAERELVDKSSTFIGSDMSIAVQGAAAVPTGLVDRATVVVRMDGRMNGVSVDVLGVDPSTFERAAIWRRDASPSSLQGLLTSVGPAEIAADGSTTLPAIVVGDVDTLGAGAHPTTLAVSSADGRQTLGIRTVGVASFFPGYRSGSVMAIVDADALAKVESGLSSYVWVRDPPSDAIDQVRAVVDTVRLTLRADDVFDVLSFSAQRWSYAALGAFGALVAIVVLTMQLLVVEARRDTRRLSHVMLGRMGFGRRSLWWAGLVEVTLPLFVGIAIGFVVSRLSAQWSVPRLDSLPNLAPSGVVVVPVATVLAAVVATVAASVVLASIGVVSTLRGKVMETVRGTA